MRLLRHPLIRVLAPLVAAGCAAQPPRAAPRAPAEPAAAEPSSRGAPSAGLDGKTEHLATRAPGPTATSNREDKAAAPAPADAPSTILADVPVADEPIYFPGGRARPKGSAVEASLDDEVVATWNRGGVGPAPAQGSKPRPSHAAPRVKVDVTEVRGDANEADMQRAARLKSYWPFRICYEQGLRRMQRLHGTIKLRLTVGPNGRPSGVQQLATELRDGAVVNCVVKSAMGLGLPVPSSGSPQVTLEISLWPGDEPVSVKTAIVGKNAAPADAQALTEALRTRWNEVRACYAAGLRRHEGLWGRLGLALRITAGIVDDVSEVESHFPDPEVTQCVRKVFLHAEIPSTLPELSVVYPLRLGHAPNARETRR
jgi:hypothetical protein